MWFNPTKIYIYYLVDHPQKYYTSTITFLHKLQGSPVHSGFTTHNFDHTSQIEIRDEQNHTQCDELQPNETHNLLSLKTSINTNKAQENR